MKLVSFDIGIKNMAYCTFLIDSSTCILVHDWRVINLMGQTNSNVEKHVCGCQLKTKPKKKSDPQIAKICGKSACFEKSGSYYCAKHAKELAIESGTTHTYILPEKSISPSSLKKLSKENLLQLCKKWYIDLSLLENNGNNQLTKPVLLDYVIKWFESRCFLQIIVKKAISASETDLITIGRNMRTQLESIIEMEGATHVIMENQISPLAGRMKTVQGMLAQYFIMQNPSPYIEFISSANKLKDFQKSHHRTFEMCKGVKPTVLENTVVSNLGQVERIDSEPTKTLRQIYTQHKTDSVSICKQILEKNPELGSWTLDDPKKKDDLADCFLQGIWYLKHAKYIICAENLKINLV
jgi:hypothetical protein